MDKSPAIIEFTHYPRGCTDNNCAQKHRKKYSQARFSAGLNFVHLLFLLFGFSLRLRRARLLHPHLPCEPAHHNYRDYYRDSCEGRKGAYPPLAHGARLPFFGCLSLFAPPDQINAFESKQSLCYPADICLGFNITTIYCVQTNTAVVNSGLILSFKIGRASCRERV